MSDGELNEWDFARSGLRSLSAAEIRRFWDGYIARREDARIEHGSLYSRWRHVADDLVLSLYVTNRSVGLFVRGQRGESWATSVNRFSAFEPDLGLALAASLRGFKGCCYISSHPLPVTDRSSWKRGYHWLEKRERHYGRVLQDIVVGG